MSNNVIPVQLDSGNEINRDVSSWQLDRLLGVDIVKNDSKCLKCTRNAALACFTPN